jgi:hypothetical protein
MHIANTGSFYYVCILKGWIFKTMTYTSIVTDMLHNQLNSQHCISTLFKERSSVSKYKIKYYELMSISTVIIINSRCPWGG